MLSARPSDVTTAPPPRCLEPDELAAFIDGTLDAAARQRALVHIDGCPDCHELLAESARSLDAQAGAAASKPRLRPWPVLAALAAAAGLTALLVHNPAHSPDRPGLPATPGTSAEARPSTPPARLASADPAAALLAAADPAALARHAWSDDEASRGFAPPSERDQALVTGVSQVDLAVAEAAHADTADLRERVQAGAPARQKHQGAFELGRLVESARLAAAARTESFFADGSVRAALGAAAAAEPDPGRARALRGVAQALAADARPRPWTAIQSGLEQALRAR